MKKSGFTVKTVFVIVLAVALLVLSIGTPSFSWFARTTSPNTISQTGKNLSLNIADGDNMIAYDGSGVAMASYRSNDDGVSFPAENPENEVDFDSEDSTDRSGTLGFQSFDDNPTTPNRIYYKTKLINKKTVPQVVSLYIKDFHTGGEAGTAVCVGVNVPIKAFKNYSFDTPRPDPVATTARGTTTKRIYFQTYADRNNWNTQNNFAVYYGANSPDSHKDLTKCKPSDSNDYLYYADLPADTNQLYFVSKDNANPNYKRSQTFTNLTGDGLSATQSLIFKHSGKYDSQKYNNAQFSVQKTTGIYVSKYYKTANMGVPTATVTDTLDLHLSSSMYGGQSITYSLAACEPEGCVTLNTTTGVVTANNLVGGISEGTATLRYTITSQYGESSTFDCSIKVKASQGSANTVANAPIVTNLYIPAATTANEVNTDGSNVQEVYWFIQNGDEMYGAATQNAQYSLGGVYLGV